jgi:branched-chain amino acid transport system ATP-binding protein
MGLEVEGVTKRFAGIVALEDVDLNVLDGESVGLIGPNGAGKTTLFNCILGIIRPEEGQVTYNGTNISRYAIHRRARLGIGRTFQRLELFGGMTARQHVLVAARAHRGNDGLLRDILGRGGTTAEEETVADEMLALVGLSEDGNRAVESLSLGQGRLVELARALATRPKLVLLDEPSSGLDRAETRIFADVLDKVHREQQLSVLLVEHDLELVLEVTTRLYVIDHGRTLASGDPGEVMANPAVREAYLGVSA